MAIQQTLREILHTLTESVFPPKEHSERTKQLPKQILLRQTKVTRTQGHIALLPYRNTEVKDFIYAMKYEKHEESLQLGATLIKKYLRKQAEGEAYSLCSIPATPTRKKQDNYDHLQMLLNMIGKEDQQLQCEPKTLTWKRMVQRQSRLKNKEERLKNVEKAMQAKDTVSIHRTWIIIDDVTTTGATLTEAKRALREQGIKKIRTIALAH